MNPLKPSPELAARIQRWIDDLDPGPGGWPSRLLKERHNAFPLHGNRIYLWGIRPDGTVVCLDHEAASRWTEPETDPFLLFAVLTQGAKRHPDLRELVPPRPPRARPCSGCDGTGWEETQGSCMGCNGMGWWEATH